MSTLNGTVQTAPNGSRGFDADSVLSKETARQFFGSGYVFCLRYLSRGGQESTSDLTTQEASDILGAGLALMPVQHVSAAGWQPTAALGTQYGGTAASHAQTIGFPAGVNVWCDLEGVDSATTASDAIAYCNAWYTAVASAGYAPGLYVGANCGLSGQQLYQDLEFQHYWKSESQVPVVATRGYQMVQSLVAQPVFGIGIDSDVTQADALGGRVLWLAPRPLGG
ncbi:MAG: DUF1906 domain-containing protein [Pseudomonadota bacterium]